MIRADLKSLWNINGKLSDEKNRLAAIDDSLNFITPIIDGLPKSTSNNSRVEKLVAAKIDCTKRIADLQAESQNVKAELSLIILTSQLDTVEINILLLRYVQCLPFTDIAKKVFLSESRVFALHRRAVKKLFAD